MSERPFRWLNPELMSEALARGTSITRAEGCKITWKDEWQNPEPGVLTWRDYAIDRIGRFSFELSRDGFSMRCDHSTLADLKALAERDFAERVEMGEVDVKSRS